MPWTIHCNCGYTFSSRDEEELYSVIRQHVDRLCPEQHLLTLRETRFRPELSKAERPLVAALGSRTN